MIEAERFLEEKRNRGKTALVPSTEAKARPAIREAGGTGNTPPMLVSERRVEKENGNGSRQKGFDWYIDMFRKYADFRGRARRTAYWIPVLFNLVIATVLSLAVIPGILYALACLVPSIALSVRRLHDTGRSGWWLFLAFVPLIGAIVLFAFMAQEGTRGDNQYGHDPKAV